MSRRLTAIFAFLSFFSIAVSAANLPISRYDLNGDGVITTADAVVLRNCLNLSAACNPAADYDNDGKITLSDYTALAKFYGQKVTKSTSNSRANVVIAASATVLKLNQVASLTANLSNGSGDVAATKWYFQDGLVKTGAQITAAFSAPGLYNITTATPLSDGGLSQSGVVLVVYDANGSLPSELGYQSKTPGNVDGTPGLTLKDAYLILKFISGNQAAIPASLLSAADANNDMIVDLEDVRLVAVAAMNKSLYYEDVSPAIAMPGTVLTIRSAVLTNPAGDVSVRFGDSGPVQTASQILPGIVTVQVPFEVPAANGTIPIILLKSNIEKARFFVDLEAGPENVVDPVAAATNILMQVKAGLAANTSAVASTAPTLGLDFDATDTITTLASTMAQASSANVDRLIKILSAPGNASLAKAFVAGVQANGFPDLRISSASSANSVLGPLRKGQFSTNASTAQVGCDALYIATCAIHDAGNYISRITNVVVYGCSAVEVVIAGLAVTGVGDLADLAVVPAFVAACGETEVGLAALTVLSDLTAPINVFITLDADKTSLSSNQTARLTARANIANWRAFCLSLGAGAASSTKLSEFIAEKVADLMVHKNVSVKILISVTKSVGHSAEAFLVAQIKRLTGRVLDAGLDKLTEKVAELCGTSSGACNQALDTKGITTGEGAEFLVAQTDGSATFTCPAAPAVPNGKYEFVASKAFCLSDITNPPKDEKTITCVASTQVTFTFGDNGSALDDIFELVVDGQSVLTSNVPVRSISTILGLSVGQHEVQLIGRAAPDGIGTYFISITGSRIISGDALTGTDLTPGAVKHYTIAVQ